MFASSASRPSHASHVSLNPSSQSTATSRPLSPYKCCSTRRIYVFRCQAEGRSHGIRGRLNQIFESGESSKPYAPPFSRTTAMMAIPPVVLKMEPASLQSESSFREPEGKTGLCARCESLHLPRLFEGPRLGDNSRLTSEMHAESRKYSVVVGPFSTFLDDSSCNLCDVLRKVHSRHHTHCDGSGKVCYLLPYEQIAPLGGFRRSFIMFRRLATYQKHLLPTSTSFLSQDRTNLRRRRSL